MSIKQKLKSYMRKNMENTKIYDLLIGINQILYHYDLKEQKKRFGKENPDKTFFVVRSLGKEAGLFALYIYTINSIYKGLQKGWIPIVDFTGDATQYNEDKPVRNDVFNAWEYYFEQPVKEYTLQEVYKSKNVVLSGWTFGNLNSEIRETVWHSDKVLTTEGIEEMFLFSSQYGSMNSEVAKLLEEEKNRIFGEKKNVLGVSVRGTDYTALKPKGHYVQPEIDDVIEKVREFLSSYSQIEGIFLTTEDEKIYQRFVKEFGELVFTSNSNRIQNYSGNGYITTDMRDNNKYEQGLEYMIEKALLAKCEYLIATRTAGSDYAIVLNNNKYLDKYVFDLGRY